LPVSIEEKPVYIMLNKPRGYISSCSQPGEAIVLDLVDVKERVFPVGRLDKDSTGLLLMTNDGRIHHRLAHPSFDHEKEYEVTVKKDISDEALHKMAKGIPMDEKITRPAIVTRRSNRRFAIILYEGRKRQIRRMVEAVGNEVKDLHRVRMAHIRLKNLPSGQWRHLSGAEVAGLMALLKE
jgi:23S rRNA pseudouridine2605 synthase